MSYTYKFIPTDIPVDGTIPKTIMTRDFGALLETYFYESTDWYTIQEETTMGSSIYQNVDARITSLVDPTTGSNIEDDWKKFTFKELTHDLSLGKMYIFNDNYWLTINVDTIKTLAQTAVVKRCNNTLRFIDDAGAYYALPCSIEYIIKENRDYATAGSAIVVPSGVMQCFVQYNTAANKITKNQRFLFGTVGNWTAYRVEGGGVNNFNNLTSTNGDIGYIRLTLVADYTNNGSEGIAGIDNLELGIANYYDNIYAISVNPSSATGDNTQTIQIYANVTLNGETVTRDVIWSSDDETVATVDSDGLVTLIAEGSTKITATLSGNSTVHDSSVITVTDTPNDTYVIVVNPNVNYILETQSTTYSVYLYKNNIQQSDTFTFNLDPRTVPSDNYTYLVIDGNTFIVSNLKMYLLDYLIVNADQGSYNQDIQIILRGAY